jgi:HK97 family phage major capsid protein
MLTDHNSWSVNNLIGYWENPSFETKDNVDYLVLEGKILKTEQNLKHIIPLLNNGILNQFSIGFTSVKYEKNAGGKGYLFKEIEIKEISIVGFPANTDTQLLEIKQHNLNKEIAMELTLEEIQKTLDTKFNDFDKSKEMLLKDIEKKLADNQKITQEKLLEIMTSFNKNTPAESEEDTFIKGITQTKQERVKTLNSFTNPEGGYLVPTGFSTELIREIFYETGGILSLATTKTVTEKSMQYPIQLTSPKARWYNEGDFTGKTNSTFKPMNIDIRRISTGTDSTWEGMNYQSSYTKNNIIFDLKEAIKQRLSYDMLYGEIQTGGLQGILTSTRLQESTTATVGMANWKDFNNMAQKIKFQAGQHFVLDQNAAEIILNNRIPTYITNSLTQVDNILNKKGFNTSIIEG